MNTIIEYIKHNKYIKYSVLIILFSLGYGSHKSMLFSIPGSAFSGMRGNQETPSDLSLIQAIKANDLDEVKEIIKSDIDLNIRDHEGRTALMIAAKKGNIDEVKELINAGAKLNIVDNEGLTALRYAAMQGQGTIDVVKALISAKANLNIQDSDAEETVLVYAIIRGYDTIAQELIRAGANPNIKDYEERTALIWAAMKKNDTIAQELIRAGANPNIKDYEGRTALIWTAIRGNHDIAKELISADAHLNIQEMDGSTALTIAASQGNLAIVKLLLSYGADFNLSTKTGMKAIDVARSKEAISSSAKPYAKIVDFLDTLQKAIEELKTSQSAQGITSPILVSVFYNYPDLQEILVKRFIAQKDNDMLQEVIKLADINQEYSQLLNTVLQDPYSDSKFKTLPIYSCYLRRIAFKNALNKEAKKNNFSDITIITQDNPE